MTTRTKKPVPTEAPVGALVYGYSLREQSFISEPNDLIGPELKGDLASVGLLTQYVPGDPGPVEFVDICIMHPNDRLGHVSIIASVFVGINSLITEMTMGDRITLSIRGNKIYWVLNS